jgi:DNA-binding response OmpR family regulator
MLDASSPLKGVPMDRPLGGCSILVVEDEPLIAMDVVQGLEAAGAAVSVARTLKDALDKVEALELSAAGLDHRLRDGDSSQICGWTRKTSRSSSIADTPRLMAHAARGNSCTSLLRLKNW